jgi:glyceraldehyde-3-phosphate dehydrogenase (NADP+)
MLIGGQRRAAASGITEEITSPWDDAVVDTVPRAGIPAAAAAVAAALSGPARWRRTLATNGWPSFCAQQIWPTSAPPR